MNHSGIFGIPSPTVLVLFLNEVQKQDGSSFAKQFHFDVTADKTVKISTCSHLRKYIFN